MRIVRESPTTEGTLKVTAGIRRPSARAGYFSITAELTKGGREIACGCMHEEIEARFPGEFSDLIALHLADIDGVPMHAEANGWYWVQCALGQREAHNGITQGEAMAILARHLRISRGVASVLVDVSGRNIEADGNGAAYRTFVAFVDTLRAGWKAEADACIARHFLKVGS